LIKQHEDEAWQERWNKARSAIQQMEAKVREAAGRGSNQTVVYQLREDSFFEIKFKLKKGGLGSYSVASGYSAIPEYAQSVYEECLSLGLSPRWEYHYGEWSRTSSACCPEDRSHPTANGLERKRYLFSWY
jgi:hypothetical protein